LLLAGLAGGRLAATTRVLPAITGYIATGFLLGPGVLGWLSESALVMASLVMWLGVSRADLVKPDKKRSGLAGEKILP
jgi:predicted Kef-type K+ transport protein